jgi:hypothetical protein
MSNDSGIHHIQSQSFYLQDTEQSQLKHPLHSGGVPAHEECVEDDFRLRSELLIRIHSVHPVAFAPTDLFAAKTARTDLSFPLCTQAACAFEIRKKTRRQDAISVRWAQENERPADLGSVGDFQVFVTVDRLNYFDKIADKPCILDIKRRKCPHSSPHVGPKNV